MCVCVGGFWSSGTCWRKQPGSDERILRYCNLNLEDTEGGGLVEVSVTLQVTSHRGTPAFPPAPTHVQGSRVPPPAVKTKGGGGVSVPPLLTCLVEDSPPFSLHTCSSRVPHVFLTCSSWFPCNRGFFRPCNHRPETRTRPPENVPSVAVASGSSRQQLARRGHNKHVVETLGPFPHI